MLAADLGERLGGGAHLRNLRRTAIGSFTIGEARALRDLDTSHVIAPADALRDYPAGAVADADVTAVMHGREIAAQHDGAWRVLDTRGELLAIYEGSRPAVVMSAAN